MLELLVTGFGAFIAGAIVAPTATRFVTRIHERGELTRDALVDINSLITALEDALPALVKGADAGIPITPDDLVDTPSGFDIPGPMIPLTRYLSCFDDEELHRLFMLIFHDHRQLEEISTDLATAYSWLIQNGYGWQRAQGREFLLVLVDARKGALECVRRLLLRCSEACARMAADPPLALSRLNRPSIHEFVRRHYKLSERDVEVRAAYYRRLGVTTGFDISARYGVYKWSGTTGRGSGPVFIRLSLENGEVIDMRADQMVALPEKRRVKSLKASEDDGDSWRDLETRLLAQVPPAKQSGCVSLKLPQPSLIRQLTD